MKFAVAALCTMFVASAYGQGLSEMMAMSALLGNRGSGSGSSGNPFAALAGGSSSSSNPLAALTGGSSSSSNPLAAFTGSGGASNPMAALTGASSGGNNPMASLMGGNMGRMAGGMMLGGAEMSNLMDFYSCGMMRLPYQMCFMMMQQNM